MSNPLDTIKNLPPQHAITIKTSRLYLRPVHASDLATVHSIRRDPAVMVHMSTGPDPEPDPAKSDSVRRIKIMMQPNHLSFAVEIRRGQPERPGQTTPPAADTIGFVGCHRVPTVFYNFKADSWGKGYATEALGAYLRCYWGEFPRGFPAMSDDMRDYLEAEVIEGNVGSQRVLEKVGFSCVGTGTMERLGTPMAKRVYRIRRPESDA